jgi:hypothetical protein
MNSGNRWKHGYTGGGVGDDWFSGKVSELVRLEHWGEKKEERKLEHQGNRKMKKRHKKGKKSEQLGKLKNIGGMRTTRAQGGK